MRRLLSTPNAVIYLIGQGLSVLGDSALWLAAAVFVKTITGSSAAAGLVFFAFTLPQLGAPFAGLLVDRVHRRPLLVLANLAGAALVLLLLLVRGSGEIWLVYAVMAGYGALAIVLGSGETALLPAMVPDDVLPDINASLQTVRQGLRLVSPLLGAGLFALAGIGVVAMLDAATFAVAACALLALRVQEPPPARAQYGWAAEVLAGVRHLGETPVLRQMVTALLLSILLIGFCETLVFAVVDRGLHRPPAFVGVLLTVQGAGSVAGGPLAGLLIRRIGGRRLFGLGLALLGAAGILLAVPELPVVLAAAASFGLGVPWVLVSAITVLQRETPAALLGRASAAFDVVLGVPQTLAIALGAALVALVDYRLLLAVCAALTLLAAFYIATRRDQLPRGGQVVGVDAEDPLQRAP
jgi:MFS family permease